MNEDNPTTPTITHQAYHVSLMVQYDPRQYRWQRSDGQWVSPSFTTKEAAHYFANKIPFLTDAEWQNCHPVPVESSELRRIDRAV